MTNYEYIKTLSAEELAEMFIAPDCPYCTQNNVDNCNIVCKEGILEWLKQEHIEETKMIDANKLVKDIVDGKYCSTEYCKSYNGSMCDAEPAFNDCPEAIINYIKAMEGAKNETD